MIALENVFVRLPKGRDILTDVTYAVRPGSLTLLSGANGSGKTTFLKVVAGLTTPSEGRVRRSPRLRLGAQWEVSRGFFPRLTVGENLDYFGTLAGPKRARFAASMATCVEAMSLAEIDTKVAQELSAGQRQRLTLTIAFAGQPDVVLLDEPTLSLDANYVAQLATVVRRHLDDGGSAVCSSHDVEFLRGLPHAPLRFSSGRMTHGSAPSAKTRYEIRLSQAPGAECLTRLSEAGFWNSGSVVRIPADHLLLQRAIGLLESCRIVAVEMIAADA